MIEYYKREQYDRVNRTNTTAQSVHQDGNTVRVVSEPADLSPKDARRFGQALIAAADAVEAYDSFRRSSHRV